MSHSELRFTGPESYEQAVPLTWCAPRRAVLWAAEANGLRQPLTEAAAEHAYEAIDTGHGEEDMAAIYQATRPFS